MDDKERMRLEQLEVAHRRYADAVGKLSQGYLRMWRHVERLERREAQRDLRLEGALEVQADLAAAVRELVTGQREQTRVLTALTERVQGHEITEAKSWTRAVMIQVGQISAILAMGAGLAVMIFLPGAAEWVRCAIHDMTGD